MTAKNLPSIGPTLRNRSSSSRGVGTVRRGRPSNNAKATRRKSIPRSASTQSRFGSSQLNSTFQHTHNCTHNQAKNHVGLAVKCLDDFVSYRSADLISGSEALALDLRGRA